MAGESKTADAVQLLLLHNGHTYKYHVQLPVLLKYPGASSDQSRSSGWNVLQLPALIRVRMKLRLLKAYSVKSWKTIQQQRLHNPCWQHALMLNYPQSVWGFFQFCFGFPFLFHLEATSFILWLLSLIPLPGTARKFSYVIWGDCIQTFKYWKMIAGSQEIIAMAMQSGTHRLTEKAGSTPFVALQFCFRHRKILKYVFWYFRLSRK